jgi:Mg2+/citrate symporter
MYLVAIAWLYVALMLAITARTITIGVLTFLFAGLLPCALLLWLMGGAHRKRLRTLAQNAQDDATMTDTEARSSPNVATHDSVPQLPKSEEPKS